MKKRLATLLLLCIAACERHQSFDQRYSKVAREIGNEARAMDSELNQAAPSGPEHGDTAARSKRSRDRH